MLCPFQLIHYSLNTKQKTSDNMADKATESFFGALRDYGTAEEFMDLIRKHRNLGRNLRVAKGESINLRVGRDFAQ